MNIKVATNLRLSTTESKKINKQAEQEQNHRYGDHLEDHQLGGEREEWGKRFRDYEVQLGRYKIDRG